ncbi:MAG: hypothetical protein M3Y82_13865 [Verrucomicrobiota bacterium]|nr:hypothetical protein [Verrucomicrobiota bacterium]
MKIFFQRNRKLGLTLVEGLVVLAVIGFIAMIWLSDVNKRRTRGRRFACINNLKQVGIGFRIYANDHPGKFPDYHITNEAWNYFQAAGNEISTPRILVCPSDTARLKQNTFPARDFENSSSSNNFSHPSHRNKSLSYFYGVDADETKPDMLLAGDRNLSTNNKILNGWLILKTNTPVRYTKDIHYHDYQSKSEEGNVVFADASVQRMTSGKLRVHLRLSTNQTQRLLLP